MEKNDTGIKISKKAFITSVVILLVLMIAAGIMTHVIPTGAFERTVSEDGNEIIVPETFAFTEKAGYPVWRWFTAPFEVLWSSDAVTVIMIILFIFIIGGTFSVMEKSRMLQYMMNKLVNKFGASKYKLMAMLILFFMLFGSVFGILEEIVPLVPIVILLAYALGWDSLTGLGMSALAAGFGFSAATLNPFTLGIAQKLAKIAPFSGILFRIGVFILFYGVLFLFVYLYAKKIEKNPSRSLVYKEDAKQKEKYSHLTAQEKLPNEEYLKKSVLIFVCAIAFIIVYIIAGFFYSPLSSVSLPVMAIVFLTGGLSAAKVSRYGGKVFKDFLSGIGGIAPSALLILMAMSVKLIITNGGIMDTILYYASEKISGMGPYAATLMIFALVLGMNFLIGSGSAKAFLLIPLIAPLSDLVGVTRQVAVQAFCFGDGFTNMLYPTNPLLMIILGVTVVGYSKWFKWSLPLQLVTLVLNVLLLLLTVVIGF